MSHELVERTVIADKCACRQQAIELYRSAYETLAEAHAVHQSACFGTPYISNLPKVTTSYEMNLLDIMKSLTTSIDKDMWNSIIAGTPIGALMDSEEREKFRHQVETDPPPATLENFQATLERLVGERGMIFRRGLVNAFSRLCREYKSNDGFKIGERIVISGGVSFDRQIGWFRVNYHREGQIHDIDRIMHVLDDKAPPQPSSDGSLTGALSEALRTWKEGAAMEAQSPYWRAKFFKNGNLHLYCLRLDLLTKANKMIAEHFGETLAAGHGAHNTTPDYRTANDTADKVDFFATPDEVVDQLIALAELSPEHSVLEPEAGEGAIVGRLKPLVKHTTAYELDPIRSEQLRKLDLATEVIRGDFLKESPRRRYDRVVMNPPFSNRQDVRHVLHALSFVEAGGKLVAIMSASTKTRNDRLTAHFRLTMKRQGGYFVDLPPDSFKVSGTLVQTVIAVIPN